MRYIVRSLEETPMYLATWEEGATIETAVKSDAVRFTAIDAVEIARWFSNTYGIPYCAEEA